MRQLHLGPTLLWCCVAAAVAQSDAFLAPPCSALPPVACRSGAPALRMQSPGGGKDGGGGKWSAPVLDESAERIESVKAGVLSAVAGSAAMTPIAVLVSSQWYPSNAFDAQWELAHDGLAVMLALFGLVYRYAVRQDPNPQVCSLPHPARRNERRVMAECLRGPQRLMLHSFEGKLVVSRIFSAGESI